MRVTAGGRASAVCTAVRGPSLYGIASKGGRIREISISNTTAIAFAAAIARFSAAGTPGAGLTEMNLDSVVNGLAASLTAFNTHTADATVAASSFPITIGAAAGAGYTWTFGEEGLLVPAGTANGCGIILPTGTGQIFDFWFVWDE